MLGKPDQAAQSLRNGHATVGEVQDAVGASQQNVSKHLDILRPADMVSCTKHGTHVRYAITDPAVFELCDQVCGAFAARSKNSKRSCEPERPRPDGHRARGAPCRK